jgi:hypothetical protein
MGFFNLTHWLRADAATEIAGQQPVAAQPAERTGDWTAP